MKRVLMATGLAVVVCLTLSPEGKAFNGQRQGFILGGGLGFGMTSYVIDVDGLGSSDRQNEFSFMTDFKIGYAPTEQVEVYYSSKGAWWGQNSVTFLHEYGTATVSYYFQPMTPSFYILGGLGLATLSAPFEDNADTDIGFGVIAGGGYEFARHFAVEFDLMYGQPGESGITFKGFVPRIVFVATAF